MAAKRVVCERLGGDADDLLITTIGYDPDVTRVIKTLPSWARHYDPASKSWRIHPAYADRLMFALTVIGCAVGE
jgi:hypothetical protein